MPETYQAYNAFISSPGDVSAERQFADEVITRINRSCLETLKVSLNVKRWEHRTPETPYLPEEQIQDRLNSDVEKAHFFILILYKRYGTVETGQKVSNTEREIEAILTRFEKHPELKILAYFRELDQNEDPGEQEQKVRDLRERLRSIGVAYRLYHGPEHFKEELTHDLYDTLLRMQISTYKVQMLQRFWQFGEYEERCLGGTMAPATDRANSLPEKVEFAVFSPASVIP